MGLYVVDVGARAEYPPPWLEELDIGDLVHRLAGARLGPAVGDQAAALALGHRDHIQEQRFAVRVPETGDVLAVELGIGRVHQHPGREIIDP